MIQIRQQSKKISFQWGQLIIVQAKLTQFVANEQIASKHFCGKRFHFVVGHVHRLQHLQSLKRLWCDFGDAIIAQIQIL